MVNTPAAIVAPAPPDDPAQAVVAAFAARRPVRAGSFILNAFGDVFAPRGGAVRMGALIALMAGVGISESLVRTATSRLVAEGWLETTRSGRIATCRLTPTGRRRFDEATRRIYGVAPPDWQGGWTTVFLSAQGEVRDLLRRELGWLGFGQAAPGVLVHPAPDGDALHAVLADAPVGAAVIAAGTLDPGSDPAALRALAAAAWDFGRLAADYAAYIDRYGPLAAALEGGSTPADHDAALARLVLIQDFRRLVLRDPLLPAALTPEGWIGDRARALTRTIYAALAAASERWFDHALEGPDGPLPPADAAFARRFGGDTQRHNTLHETS